MEFNKVIKEREAVRSFKDTKVEKEKIEKILEAGNLAPTAKNLQPQKIYVVESKEWLEKLDTITPCRYNAPLVLIVCSDKSIAWHKDDYSTYEMDACIVATHMMLASKNENIDSIWIEMFDKTKLKELLNLDDNIEPICLLPLGYQTDDYPGNPNHNIRKDLNEIVEYL
ncbi:MAG: nitroreductase family protein [Bacilli bacterium]|nr:nitroreductase family protein [Bacilli bacterium]